MDKMQQYMRDGHVIMATCGPSVKPNVDWRFGAWVRKSNNWVYGESNVSLADAVTQCEAVVAGIIGDAPAPVPVAAPVVMPSMPSMPGFD